MKVSDYAELLINYITPGKVSVMSDIIDVNTLFGPLPTAASDLPPDELGEMMKKNAVSRCFTVSTIGVLLDHKAGNAATRAACSENRQLVPVATINPQRCFDVPESVSRLADDGFKMVRFFPWMQGWEPDYAPFIALAKEMQAQELPVMINIDRPGVASRMMQALGNTTHALILAGVNEKWMTEATELMRQHPNLYMETSYLLGEGALQQIASSVGADRILYGSGAPSRPMAAGIGVMQHTGLTDNQRDLMLAGNASRIFNF